MLDFLSIFPDDMIPFIVFAVVLSIIFAILSFLKGL